MLRQILPYENILIPSSFLSPSSPGASRFYAWWIGFRRLQMLLNPYSWQARMEKGLAELLLLVLSTPQWLNRMHLNLSVHEKDLGD
jgi:hypothetical protein